MCNGLSLYVIKVCDGLWFEAIVVMADKELCAVTERDLSVDLTADEEGEDDGQHQQQEVNKEVPAQLTWNSK